MKVEGYTCDGGCGAQTVTTQPAESLSEHGWWTIFPGRGAGQPLHCCSAQCGVRALQQKTDELLANVLERSRSERAR